MIDKMEGSRYYYYYLFPACERTPGEAEDRTCIRALWWYLVPAREPPILCTQPSANLRGR